MRDKWKKLLFFGTFAAVVGAVMSLDQRGAKAPSVVGADSGWSMHGDGDKFGPPVRKLKARAVPIGEDYVRWALQHAQTLRRYDARYARYIAIREAEVTEWRSTSLALHKVGRGSSYRLPVPVASGYLLYFDSRWYYPTDRDQREFNKFWEELAFDPLTSLLLTRDAIKSAEQQAGFDAKTTVIEVMGVQIRADVDVIRINSGGIEVGPLEELQSLCQTQAPVVESRYLKRRILDTIKNDKDVESQVYATVWGGLYYEFAGVRKAADVLGKNTKATDLDLFFEDLGIGNIRGGVTFDKLFDDLRSDQRAITEKSEVTGKVREFEAIQTPAVRPDRGSSFGVITGDTKDGNIDIRTFAFANLAKPKFDAREARFPTRLGFIRDGLFDGKGSRVDSVPETVAVNDLIPRGHTKVFGAGLACEACHGVTAGARGWQQINNDVRKLLEPGGRFDVFGDRGFGPDRTKFDEIDRLRGQYEGEFRDALDHARIGLAQAYLRATTFPGHGPWPGGKGDLTDIVPLGAQRLWDEQLEYWYAQVDAREACKTLGIDPGDEIEPVKLLRLLLPPVLGAVDEADDGKDQVPFVREDPTLALLMQGLTVSRSRWALAQGYASERSKRSDILKLYRGEIPWWGRN